ncbi:hypothetical protein ACOSQ4_023577 [Xanthoceras sorbifolium]
MDEIFTFSAQLRPEEVENGSPKLPKKHLSSKRAGADQEEKVLVARKSLSDSFKAKLMNSLNPYSWAGFGAKKEKLKIK